MQKITRECIHLLMLHLNLKFEGKMNYILEAEVMRLIKDRSDATNMRVSLKIR